MRKTSGQLSTAQKLQQATYSSVPMAQIVWLRQRNELDSKSENLYAQLQNQGFSLVTVDAFEITSQQLLDADLILVNAFGQVDGMVETIVSRVRFESRVPLIMLTDGYSTEQLVTALTAGADAIWSLNTPIELLLARCKALLRRWPPADR